MAGKNLTAAQRWQQQATDDLAAARWNFQGEFFHTTCFLAQQAAAKALTSLLYYLDARRPALLTHSVATMIKPLEREVPGLAETLEMGRLWDLHDIPARYPNGLPDGVPYLFYGKETATQALAATAKILMVIDDW
ncbi:MAG: HEPN domain-containing protein [Desulfobacca sp.]|uniref:HEPN domain-containing protein n=1 Tax=Desulfobacca sp. TaxID=2067990 RepID=UPI00404B164F